MLSKDILPAVIIINDDYTCSYVTTVNLPSPYQLQDIAISPSNTFYGIAEGKLIQFDITTGNFTELNQGIVTTGLVCADDNNLYYIAENLFGQLYRYDLSTNTVNFVQDLHINTPGDLTFYKGNIIFQGMTGGNEPLDLMAYNLESQTLSQIVDLNTGLSNAYFGLMNVFDSCGENKIIGSSSQTLVEFDLENGTMTTLTTFATYTNVWGMASPTEHAASACTSFQFEGLNTTDWNARPEFFVHPNPAADILEIETLFEAGEIKLYDINGRLMIQQPLHKKSLDMTLLAQGIYIIKIESSNKNFTSRVIKK
jgi:type IX secretion system substrate protein